MNVVLLFLLLFHLLFLLLLFLLFLIHGLILLRFLPLFLFLFRPLLLPLSPSFSLSPLHLLLLSPSPPRQVFKLSEQWCRGRRWGPGVQWWWWRRWRCWRRRGGRQRLFQMRRRGGCKSGLSLVPWPGSRLTADLHAPHRGTTPRSARAGAGAAAAAGTSRPTGTPTEATDVNSVPAAVRRQCDAP